MLTGTLLALTSAIAWALANVAIQSVARRLGSWGALVWAQILGSAAVATVALAVEGVPRIPSARTAIAVGVAGVAGLAAYAGLFEALRRGQVAVVTPIISAWSVVSSLLGIVWLGQPLTPIGAVGIAAVVLGNLVVTRSRATGEGTPRAAIIWALVAMLSFGLMVPAVDVVGTELGRFWAVPIVWTAELVLGIPLLGRLGLLSRPRGLTEWSAVARAAFFEGMGFVAVSLALGMVPVRVVSPISSLSTAGSVLLGVLVLRERLSAPMLAGAGLACAGVVFVNLSG